MSDYREWCQGAADANRYFLGMNVTTAKVPIELATAWSDGLDRINAFDKAEVNRVWMGQINRIEVSSFCSPDGLIWGHDVVSAGCLETDPLFIIKRSGANLPVFSADPLIDASAALFGDSSGPRWPLAPGTLCPAASKYTILHGAGTVFATCAVGLRVPGARSANILMEDTGYALACCDVSPTERKRVLSDAIARSVVSVAVNQNIGLSAILVAYVEQKIEENEVGCALTLAPYFRLPRVAMPKGGLYAFMGMDLEEWKRSIEVR